MDIIKRLKPNFFYRKLLTKTFLVLILMLASCKAINKDEKMNNDHVSYYSIVWKYVIRPEHKSIFEHEYGSSGTWANYFSRSNNYLGSSLQRSEEEENTYLLIDTWKSKVSYEDFKEKNRESYNSISLGFEHLYEIEEKIGSFSSIQ